MRRSLQVMLGAALASILAAGLMSGWGQNASAARARPSLQGLQLQIDLLNGRVNQLEGLVDTLEPVLYVFDATSDEVGRLVDFLDGGGSGSSNTYYVYLDAIAASVRLSDQGQHLPDFHPIYFDQPDCQGQPYVKLSRSKRLTAPGGPPGAERFFVGRAAPYTTLTSSSELFLGGCVNESREPVEMIPADEIVLEDLDLSFPLPGPLHIAPLAP